MKNKTVPRFFGKVVVFILIAIAWDIIFGDTSGTIVANKLAVNQMSTSATSSYWIQVYENVANRSIEILTLAAMIIFSTEIKLGIKKIILKIKGDQNEEN